MGSVLGFTLAGRQQFAGLESQVFIHYTLPMPRAAIPQDAFGTLALVKCGGAQRSNVLSKRSGQEAGGMFGRRCLKKVSRGRP